MIEEARASADVAEREAHRFLRTVERAVGVPFGTWASTPLGATVDLLRTRPEPGRAYADLVAELAHAPLGTPQPARLPGGAN
ncbi:MAG: hypothetical protein KF709_02745 [Gemmatimonadaceae bacterium]|nr:hypothetical protein [Gemmatimonadaceae bacterium]